MNRNDEYFELLSELDHTPLSLDYTLERAQARQKSRKHSRIKKAIFVPLCSLFSLFAMFVLLVNVSPSFAFAAGKIPLIGDLAKFVAFSTSLSAAVENNYVQPINLEQTEKGIRAKIEYVIVDQKQLNIFYSLSSELYKDMAVYPTIKGTEGSKLQGYSLSSDHSPNIENGVLRKVTMDFSVGDMPESLTLTLGIRSGNYDSVDESAESTGSEADNEIKYISSFEFALKLDPTFTAQGEILEINHEFSIDEQSFMLETVEIYPTHIRLVFGDKPENTAWLKNLECYVENEKGERFDGISNGLSSRGKAGSPMMATYMMESPFFSHSKHLTLYITSATWLNKDRERVRIDLANQSGDFMPEGVRIESITKPEKDWLLEFSAPETKENHSYELWSWDYFDAEGKKYSLNAQSSTGGSHLGDLEDRFTEQFSLIDYPYDEVWLSPQFTDRFECSSPVKIEIK